MISPALNAKILALRAKTTAAGCTEAEALAAAEAAARLMAAHQVGEADLDVSETQATSSGSAWRLKLLSGIACCTNTAVRLGKAQGIVVFIGREPGPEIALYLRDLTFRAVDTAAEAFKASKPYRARRALRTKRQMLGDFRDTMAARLSLRLIDVFSDTIDDVQRSLARQAMNARYGAGRTMNLPERDLAYATAAEAGWRAGEAVRLSRAVSGGQSVPKQLGGHRGES